MDVALACGEPLLQKDGQIDFAHEADALRILPFGRRQEMCIRDSLRGKHAQRGAVKSRMGVPLANAKGSASAVAKSRFSSWRPTFERMGKMTWIGIYFINQISLC